MHTPGVQCHDACTLLSDGLRGKNYTQIHTYKHIEREKANAAKHNNGESKLTVYRCSPLLFLQGFYRSELF